MSDRRTFLQRALGLGAGLVVSPALAENREPARAGTGGPASESAGPIKRDALAGDQPQAPISVVTTDVADLPFEMVDGWKVFRLRAEPIRREVVPGKVLELWGFNGSAPGPTIQVTQGDRVRILFENRLPEPTSIHWHGFEAPLRFDGMPNISQQAVPPGGQYTYEFHITQTGTFFYHSHMAMQQMVGMLGGFIMHPAVAHTPPPDHDFLIHLQEYAVLPTNTVPNSMQMEFNWLVLNGKSGPAPTPLVVRLGSRVRIRFVNMGMDHHPMHLHGHTFYVTGTEGGRIPQTAWWPGNTVLVGVAQAREIEFVANNPGNWMLHCHLPHHMMNQMVSSVGPMSRTAAHASSTASQMDMQNAMQLQVAPDANTVPNYPQDALMESPMMNMDRAVDKPENFGLPPGWSEHMQGMMTFLRVLPAAQYDEVMRRVRAHGPAATPVEASPGMDGMQGMPATNHSMHHSDKEQR